MIFQHTHEWVLGVSPHTGKPKTQTRRIVKAGQRLENVPRGEWGIKCWCVLDARGRAVYGVGQKHAVQPGRTLKALGYTDPLRRIVMEDVRNISQADVEAEGFNLAIDYLELWVKMHDPTRQFFWDGGIFHQWRGRSRKWEVASLQSVMDCLNDRPAANYTAWVLDWGQQNASK